jgi:carbonic anhydrase
MRIFIFVKEIKVLYTTWINYRREKIMRQHSILKTLLKSTFLCSLSLTSFAVTWDYQKANDWGNLDPSFETCKTGKHQSPINIQSKTTKTLKNAPSLEYHFNFNKDSFVEKQYDDVTLQDKAGKSIVHTGHSLRVDVDSKGHDFVKFKDKEYHLLQFHLHAPSEHTLNGKHFPLEIHFVNTDEKGNLFVIGVFFEKGKANASLQALIDNAPAAQKQSFALKDPAFVLSQLIPQNSNYYAYTGSLTTPPCNEPLQWIVLEKPEQASEAQIKALEKILDHNVRPLQKVGQNVVTNNILA